jgi:NADH:ubiquinone oxidoreductase subunit E
MSKAQEILENLVKEIGIKVSETSDDGNSPSKRCGCLGACGLAPVYSIGEDTHGSINRQTR